MKRIAFIAFAIALMTQTQARAYRWQPDPAHTYFYFEAMHIYATVRGTFTDFKGDVFFDPAAPEKGSLNFTVQVDSINTNNARRDNHLRSDDFFAASEYPVMTFKSSRISHAGGNRYLVTGKMTIKDVSKDLTLEFLYGEQKENPLNRKEYVAGLETRFRIDRLEYHVGTGKYYTMGVVGKDIDILLSIELLRDK